MNGILNHLVQSTLFAFAVAIAVASLKRNSPRLRYWLWLAASLKFLVPFSLIVATGAKVQLPPDTPSLHAVTVQQISTYFAPVPALHAPATFDWLRLLAVIWVFGALLLIVRWFRRWRTIQAMTCGAAKLDLRCSIPVFSSPATIEPGVFGIFRPVLLLPEGLRSSLTPSQFAAVVTHELQHARYRDNLTAAFHMLVEALFWFHPLVWFIGARLVEERELDCDEAVLRNGSLPGDYARSIVQVCETYLGAPLACASGISSSDLKKRIREIMGWRGSTPITRTGKAVLAVAALTALSLPLIIGIMRAQTLPPEPAYGYEVASVHRSDPLEKRIMIGPGPQGGFRTANTTAMALITVAYKIADYQINGAPNWTLSDRFDVTFIPDKTEIPPDKDSPPRDGTGFIARNQQRLQAVLRDRFGLVLRTETRELPIFSMVQAKNGSKLNSHDPSKPASLGTNGTSRITGSAATSEDITKLISSILRRSVRDDTHLNGTYDFKLEWTPDPDASPDNPTAPLSDSNARGSIFTAIQDQLGLRLESTKGPVQVYVVEKIERPSEN